MSNKVIWAVRNRQFKEKAKELAKEVSLNPIVTEFMISKGYNTKEKIHHFFHFKETDLRHASTLKDYRPFMDRLLKAIKENEEITIYGDYDADGVMASVIWLRALRQLSCKVNSFINHRFNEGYGLNVKGMQRLLSMYPKTHLIITCDNGIVAFDGVDFAQSNGVDVIISDHHVASPDGKLPNCPTVCEHRLDESDELKESMCGAEMSRRLVAALKEELDKNNRPSLSNQFVKELFAFSGTATITDSVPLTAANHFVATRGLQMIQNGVFPAFNFLKTEMGIDELSETTIGFQYGPVINAISRLTGDVSKDVEFFCYDNRNIKGYDRFEAVGKELLSYNAKRKELSALNNKVADEQWDNMPHHSCVVLSDPLHEELQQYDEGICGLVASHMVERVGLPTVIFAPLDDDPTVYKGSARSIEGLNIKTALDQCSDLLLGYGGHAGAAGLSIKHDNIPAFRQRLSDIIDDSKALLSDREIIVDYAVTPAEITPSLIVSLNKLRPFGNGFERLKVAIIGNIVKTTLLPIKSDEKKHVCFTLSNKGVTTKVFWWNCMDAYNELMKDNPTQVAVIGEIRSNIVDGMVVPEVTIENNAIRPYFKNMFVVKDDINSEIVDESAAYNEE